MGEYEKEEEDIIMEDVQPYEYKWNMMVNEKPNIYPNFTFPGEGLTSEMFYDYRKQMNFFPEGIVSDITEYIRETLYNELYKHYVFESIVEQVYANLLSNYQNQNIPFPTREKIRKQLRDSTMIFNGGILPCYIEGDEYFLLGARIVTPIGFENIFEIKLPTMWRSIVTPDQKFKSPSGWNNQLDAGAIFLFKIFDIDKITISYKILDADFTALQSFNLNPTDPYKIKLHHSHEDPRIYKGADNKYYMSSVRSYPNKNCDIDGIGEIPNVCGYMDETEIQIIKDTSPLKLHKLHLDYENSKKICLNVIREAFGKMKGNMRIIKNISHVEVNGRDYFVDFYPDYTVFEKNGEENCVTINMDKTFADAHIKELIKNHVISTLPRGKSEMITKKLLSFAGTTPSVKVNIDRFKELTKYPGDKQIYAGVAHVRSSISELLGQNTDDTIQLIAALEQNRETHNYAIFLKKIINIFGIYEANGLKVYLHPDLYLMCVYYFDSEFQIIGLSDIFIPVHYDKKTIMTSRFLLAFPVGLMFSEVGEIYITYGEGDIKLKLLRTNMSILGYHNNDSNLQYNIDIKILDCLSTDDNQTNSTIDDMKYEQYDNPFCLTRYNS